MNAIGPVLPVLLREAVDSGFHNYRKSRALDPNAQPDYGECSKANMLYDRIGAVLRDIVDASGSCNLRWQFSGNRRATEVMHDPHFAFRIKRAKANRGGRTSSYNTLRQRTIKSRSPQLVVGQQVLPFPDWTVPDEYRLWLTVSFDLDQLEESLAYVKIGVELRKQFLWKIPLPEPEPDVVASLPSQIADRVKELRQLRSA